jgi:hypothetical protein
MPERAGSCQKPPEYGALPGQKLDLSVFKGSFWGWFGSRHANHLLLDPHAPCW